jgi:hypothetical protein
MCFYFVYFHCRLLCLIKCISANGVILRLGCKQTECYTFCRAVLKHGGQNVSEPNVYFACVCLQNSLKKLLFKSRFSLFSSVQHWLAAERERLGNTRSI